MFEASNGVKVDAPDSSYMTWEWRNGVNDLGFASGSSVGRAVAEFFQAQRDEDLGRWRSKENPDWVVYPSRREGTPGKGRAIQVYSETLNKGWDVLESSPANRIRTGTHLDVAREWFETHPELKPTTFEQFQALPIGTTFRLGDASFLFCKTGYLSAVRYGEGQMKNFSDVLDLGAFSHWKDATYPITVL